MSDVKDPIRHSSDEELVIDADYVKRGIAEGMKGFFTPYMSLYEAVTGKQHQLVKRNAKNGRFVSTRREREQGHDQKKRA